MMTLDLYALLKEGKSKEEIATLMEECAAAAQEKLDLEREKEAEEKARQARLKEAKDEAIAALMKYFSCVKLEVDEDTVGYVLDKLPSAMPKKFVYEKASKKRGGLTVTDLIYCFMK